MTETPLPAAPELIRVGALEIRYLQHAASGREMGLFEMRVPPGAQVPPPHSHPANEELVYVLDGVLRYTVAGATRDLRAGDFMATPRGAVHAFSNPHAVEARARDEYAGHRAAVFPRSGGDPECGRAARSRQADGDHAAIRAGAGGATGHAGALRTGLRRLRRGVREEQQLAVDPVAGDGGLAGARDHPVGEMLRQVNRERL